LPDRRIAVNEVEGRRREHVSRADEELAAQIADAPAPLWRHVREVLDRPRP
jgi:hypothetical protein